MKRKLLTRFRLIYAIDTFMKIIVNRVRYQSPVLIYVLRIVGEEGLIPNTNYLPTMKLISSLDNLQSITDKKIVTVCGGGGMSLVAADILIQAGFKDVKSLKGGMELWYKRGYPTTKSRIE